MYKILAAVVCLAGLPCLAHADSVGIELDAGVLRNAVGGVLPDGTLLQLVAAQDGVFTSPTSGSFTSGDVVVIDSFTLDSAATTGNPGEIDDQITITLSATVTAGEKFALRWFPGLTLASTSPGTGQTFGQFRSDTAETPFATYGPNAPWVLPAGGSSGTTILFTTISSQFNGPYADNVGNANMTVTPLPEPSTYAMISLAAVGLVGMKLRQRRARQN